MSGLGSMSGFRRSVGCLVALVVALVAGAGMAGAAGSTWNVAKVGGPTTGDDVVIAVVDTGVDARHPAFGGRVLAQINVVDGEGDDNGHGTHVAGTAAGGSIDCGGGSTAIGVAPEAQILPVRVLDEDGTGTVDAVAEGIRAAADRGAEVINLSLGPEISLGDVSGANDTLEDAIEEAWSKGSIPVLAAGNGSVVGGILGSGYGDLPAMVVTATTRDDTKAGYATSVGSAKWGIAAPGGDGGPEPTVERDVLSAWKDDQCALLAGTSMAAPHVSGALAVLRSRGLSPQEAVDRTLSTARPIGPRSTYGAGLLDVAAAVEGLSGATTTTTDPTSASPTTADATTTTTTSADAAPATQRPASTDDRSTVPSTSARSPTTAAPTSEQPPTTSDRGVAEVAGNVRVDGEDPGGRVGGPLAVAAGVTCAFAWVLLGRAAVGPRV